MKDHIEKFVTGNGTIEWFSRFINLAFSWKSFNIHISVNLVTLLSPYCLSGWAETSRNEARAFARFVKLLLASQLIAKAEQSYVGQNACARVRKDISYV